MQRILAVDVGLKRIGIAQSDPTGVLASPLGTFTSEQALQTITAMCQRGEVRLVLIGWPLTLRGEEGEAVRMAAAFRDSLQKKVSNIPISTLDERFTSTLAQQSIRDSGARKKKRQNKSLVDATAAAILLQSYLDSR